MHKGNMQKTRKLLKSILIDSKNEVFNDIKELFGVVDEEPITFAFILAAKRLIKKKENELMKAVSKDIESILKKHKLRATSTKIKSYVNKSLIVDVEGHNRAFEGKTSGNDYGLFFEVPQVLSKEKRIRPLYNGILIQAKRNALIGKKFGQYGKLSNEKFDFAKVSHFMSLGLYEYENENNPHLSNITFVTLSSIEGDKQDFTKEIKKALSDKGIYERLSSEEFYSSFFDGKIGTNDKTEIEKYIRQGKDLPPNALDVRIHFKDDGEELFAFIKQRKKNVVKEKAVVKTKIG